MAGVVMVPNGLHGYEETPVNLELKREKGRKEEERQNQISLLAVLVAAVRKSVVACRMDGDDGEDGMHGLEIGWPTDVRHVAHVTFDRFNGFLGLPVEFELEIPCQAPSASTSVFGVSPESMQCGYDSRGNSVPKILLLMQERLYAQGGLKAEGIFRITPENGQEELVREQLNKGIVPDDIDVHCLASLIKAWLRELPRGVLDGISPEQVLQCNTEEECVELMTSLPPTQAALLGWAVELMADVVEEEEYNKMNPRNVAMVFAPNMTQMSDPLTALMHAVQVMNLLKTLILKTLGDREDEEICTYSPSSSCTMLSDREIDNNSNNTDEGYNSCSKGNTETETSYSSEVEDCDSLREIEECFLKRLEWKQEETTRLSFSESNFDRSVVTDSEARLEEKSVIEEEVCNPKVNDDSIPCVLDS
ncbi:rho GTPase-activating protein 2-like isoform X2 [Carex rostrata]